MPLLLHIHMMHSQHSASLAELNGVMGKRHPGTACRYIVLPQRPAGTEGWSEEQLQSLVTRDSMIGVTLAKTLSA